MGQVFAEVLFCHVNITTAPCGFLPSVICSVTGNQGALWQRRQLESCKGAEWTVVAFKPLLVALPGHTGTRVLAEVHFSTCSLLMSFKGRRARPAPAVIFFFFSYHKTPGKLTAGQLIMLTGNTSADTSVHRRFMQNKYSYQSFNYLVQIKAILLWMCLLLHAVYKVPVLPERPPCLRVKQYPVKLFAKT